MASFTVNYGPLAGLIGIWSGDKGIDIAPDPKEDREENPYYETITFTGAGYANNAEQQLLAAVRYHIEVRRKADDEVFHDQTGYWMWDKKEDIVMQSLSIPRGVTLLAGGVAMEIDNGYEIRVACDENDAAWSIVQSPFMHENAKTTSFTQTMILQEDTLHYAETTMLEIYNKTFEHTDTNTLIRVK